MASPRITTTVFGAALAASLCATPQLLANGGPFVIKYPKGDPAAKGVLARVGPNLRPGRETRLRVAKEDLQIVFGQSGFRGTDSSQPPIVRVSAGYTIENPTEQDVEVDFGFPVLRGIYVSPSSMMPRPDMQVSMKRTDTDTEGRAENLSATIISNSAIYGTIRERARAVIEEGIKRDPGLAKLISQVQASEEGSRETPRQALAQRLTTELKWTERDAALMVEYASLDFGQVKVWPPDRERNWWIRDGEMQRLMNANLGPLGAIGEQKATQFFAQLASRFDRSAAAAYEAIFSAWGGDVRERSVDLQTGKLRPREVAVDTKTLGKGAVRLGMVDPTIYARVDYLDPNAKISDAEKASCKAVLKNLPVVFTFAPMNLLHYTAKFPANSTHLLTVAYSQYAFSDTRAPSSYQLAYVVHPASLWDRFGPINLEVFVPQGVPFRASVPSTNGGTVAAPPLQGVRTTKQWPFSVHKATLADKTGELLLAVDAEGWKKFLTAPKAPEAQTAKQAKR